jgi:hypothetical protein
MKDPLRRRVLAFWLNAIVNTWRLLAEKETANTDQGWDSLTGTNEVLARLNHSKPYLLPDL